MTKEKAPGGRVTFELRSRRNQGGRGQAGIWDYWVESGATPSSTVPSRQGRGGKEKGD